jgi:hypothetical protein
MTTIVASSLRIGTRDSGLVAHRRREGRDAGADIMRHAQAGELYVNVHSAANPGGGVRAHVAVSARDRGDRRASLRLFTRSRRGNSMSENGESRAGARA